MNIVDIIGTDRNIIPYRPELRKIAGTINATILLQQVIYYCAGSTNGKFYKFKSPCNHPKYVAGDSWIEKLGFSEKEFEGALANIAYKKGKSKNNVSEEKALVFFYTDMDRCTWYSLNEVALNKALNELYIKDKTDFTYSTKRTLRKGQKGLYIKDEKEVTIVKDKKDFTIHTEITKEEIHKEENSGGSVFENKTAESFFQKEFDELKEYFSEIPEKINLSLAENKVEVENLSDFDFQSENNKHAKISGIDKIYSITTKETETATEGKIKANNDNIPMGETYQIPFSEFWEKYQKKEGKSEAEKKWLKIKDKEREIIMEGLDNYVSRPDNQKENRKYQPMASTFLSQKRYLDDNYAEKQTLKSKTNGNQNYNPRDWDEETGNFAFEFLFGKAH